MKSIILFIFLILTISSIKAQTSYNYQNISNLEWKLDYKVYLKLKNDSTYSFDIGSLFHVSNTSTNFKKDFIFYPATLKNSFIDSIQQNDSLSLYDKKNYKTLWGALHESIGGGWVHFTNCLLYAFETGQLSLTAPLMKRPLSSWKPKPPTESYLRTKKWEYYVPVKFKNAKKEFKLRQKEGDVGDLSNIPEDYINMFLKTNNKKYDQLQKDGNMHDIAKINLIKLLLGVNYLGEAQISYIRSKVLNSVKSYTANKLPTIIIFDEYDAAAILSLDLKGYQLERIAFKNTSDFSEHDVQTKTLEIKNIIEAINEYNDASFKKKLDLYYNE